MSSDLIYDRLMAVSVQPSTLKKRQMLAEMPAAKSVLNYALSPMISFGITIPGLIEGTGTAVFSKTTNEILHALQTRRLTGHDAVTRAIEYTRQLTPKSAKLFKHIVNKTLTIGMGPTEVNKVFPGLIEVHSVALASTIPLNSVKFPMYASFKIDGMRATYRNGSFLSRKGFPIPSVQWLADRLKGYGFEGFDGELTVPQMSFQEACGKLRRYDAISEVLWHVFDVSTPDLLTRFRHDQVYDTLHKLGKHELVRRHVRCVKHTLVSSVDEVEKLYEHARSLGYEGLILKDPYTRYRGKRTKDWIKFKPGRFAGELRDIDLPIVGVYQGQGKYAGLLGGITCAFRDGTVNIGTGFTDEERRHFWFNSEEIIGKVAQIRYMEETEGGKSLRHPSFFVIREDKYAEEE